MIKTLGIILIALGLLGLAWGGFTYQTTEKVIGSISGRAAPGCWLLMFTLPPGS